MYLVRIKGKKPAQYMQATTFIDPGPFACVTKYHRQYSALRSTSVNKTLRVSGADGITLVSLQCTVCRLP